MKKIILCAVLLVCLGIGGIFAADFTQFPEGIGPGPMINVGIGYGYTWGWNIKLPPIVASVDFPVSFIGGLPFTLGGGAGIAIYGYDGIYSGINYRYTELAILGRFGYHPDLGVPNLDVYAIASLGIWLEFLKYAGGGYYSDYNSTWFHFGFGGSLGVRYYFTSFLGVWAEVGYTSLTVISGGVSFKF